MKKNAFLGLLPVLALMGCASQPVSLQVDQVAKNQTFETQPFVTVLSQPPASPYIVIAKIEADGAQGITKQQVIAAVMQKAQNLGANAVIIQDQTSEMAPALNVNPSGGQYVNMPPQILPKFNATAILIENSANK